MSLSLQKGGVPNVADWLIDSLVVVRNDVLGSQSLGVG